MMPKDVQRHFSVSRFATTTRPFILPNIVLLTLLLSMCCLVLLYIFPFSTSAQPFSQEARIVTELKEVAEDFGFNVEASVINNRYTGMQDLVVSTSEERSYETENFLRTVCAATATVTSQSPTYQTFIDMLIMDINGELWAISTASCREAFSLTTDAKQNALLKSRLQQLK